MTNSCQVNTTAFNLKLKLKNRSTKVIWYITNIQKDQITILSKHLHKNIHELTILSRSNTPEIASILKKLNRPHITIDLSNKNLYSLNPANLTETYIKIFQSIQLINTQHIQFFIHFDKILNEIKQNGERSSIPVLALEKFTGLDPNEDARDFLDIVEKKIAFSLGT